MAKRVGLSAIALTDHDTVGGIAEARAAAEEAGIDFLAGIEISCRYPQPGVMHLLGYGIDPTQPELARLIDQLIAGREARNPKIIERLRALGIDITLDEVIAKADGGVIGRPHFAAVLIDKGRANSVRQAFDWYLAPGAPAYVEKERVSAREAIDAIRQAGGIAVLAHPSQLRTTNDAQLDRVIKDLVDVGLGGIEVLHSDHDSMMVRKAELLSRRYGLLPTGGSDFHGSSKAAVRLGWAGRWRVPRAWYDGLVAAVAGARGGSG